MRAVLTALDAFAPAEVDMAIAALMEVEVPIKRLLMLLEMARQSGGGGGERWGGEWRGGASPSRTGTRCCGTWRRGEEKGGRGSGGGETREEGGLEAVGARSSSLTHLRGPQGLERESRSLARTSL